ncbi:hypothetical protein [Aliiroseovarius sp. F20344]|uniref:hypothetical protein n=1 Tax=Aliiroseovarius sp. F20344 TaxID=2926414 RepID=UPI001FF0F79B|nr:hypothetical protein [Aliiroseovarius sp. F20344]MCK0143389.1 hypothetical protein [Aliiroseovarius sp. F20344]
MTMVSPLPKSGAETSNSAQPVLLSPAQWGYSLHDQVNGQSGESIARAFSRILGIALVISSLGLWVIPSASGMGDGVLLIMKLGLTCLFIGLGGLLYMFGKANGASVTQVDLYNRTIRRGRVSEKNAFETEAAVPFEDVKGLLLSSDDSANAAASMATLYLRLDDGEDNMTAIEILKGPEALLRPIRERLLRDLKNDRGGLPLPSFESRKVARYSAAGPGLAFQAA